MLRLIRRVFNVSTFSCDSPAPFFAARHARRPDLPHLTTHENNINPKRSVWFRTSQRSLCAMNVHGRQYHFSSRRGDRNGSWRRHRVGRDASDVEHPPQLLTGEESVSGFLWWSHFAAFRSFDGPSVNHVADLLAGALLYADGHSAPSCASILGHHKVVPDCNMESMSYPIAVIQSGGDSRADARRRRIAVTPEVGDSGVAGGALHAGQSPPTLTAPKSVPSPHNAVNSCALNGAGDCQLSPSGEHRGIAVRGEGSAHCGVGSEVSGCASSVMFRDSSLFLPLVQSHHRLALMQTILAIKEGPERALEKNFMAAMGIVLSAGSVAFPCEVLEAPSVVIGVLGRGRADGRATDSRVLDGDADGVLVGQDAFIALLVALVACRTASHAIVYGVIRMCLLCGILLPDPVLRQLGGYLSTKAVGHANAAARMASDLSYEVGPMNFQIPQGLSRRFVGTVSQQHDGGLCHGAAAAAALVGSPEHRGDIPLATPEVLCNALSKALCDGEAPIAEATRLLDLYVPCLVSPLDRLLITTLATPSPKREGDNRRVGVADGTVRKHLLNILKERCTAVERLGFEAAVRDALMAAQKNPVPLGRSFQEGAALSLKARSSLTPPAKPKGSKLQRALQGH